MIITTQNGESQSYRKKAKESDRENMKKREGQRERERELREVATREKSGE